VLARERTLREINELKSKTTAELEVFSHGARCVSYSGRCLLSSFMAGRDGNAGNCAQACRWKYFLTEEKRPGEFFPIEEDSRGSYIFNSKDLCMIKHIPDLDGLAALKIEGRNKSAYYAGTVVKAYREALDDYYLDPELYFSKLDYYFAEVGKNSHRDFTTGFFYGAGEQNYLSSSYTRDWDFVGKVLDYQNGLAKIEQRNKIVKGDIAEFVRQDDKNFFMEITEILDENFEQIKEAPRAQQIIYIRTPSPVKKYDALRVETKNKK
jgi:putative protease